MGAFASGAVYLATLSGPPPAVADDPPARAAAAAPAPARPYMIVDLPAAAGRARPVEAALADVVRWDAGGGLDSGDFADAQSPADLNAAVLAEHGARIAALRTRMAALKAEPVPGGAVELAGLGVKLRRAEAAQKLAMARATLAEACAGGCEAPAVRVAPEVEHAAPVALRLVAAAKPVAVVKPVRVARAMAAPPPAVGEARGPVPVVHAAAWIGREQPVIRRVARVTTTTGPKPAMRQPDPQTAATLAHARRLLAKARAALEGGAPAPAVQLTGLWQWDGSESWSLADAAKRNV